jgi:ketosteroid isomerase-like protein
MAKKRPTKKARPAAARKAATKRPRPKAKVVKRARPAAKAAKPAKRKAPAPKARRAIRPAAPAVNAVRALAQHIVDLTATHNDEAAFALYADNVESVEPGMPPQYGIDALKQKFAMWRSMTTDSTWRARTVCVDGNTIVIEWQSRVTWAATGQQSDLNEVAIHEVDNGKIVRERFYYDRTAMPS